MIKARAAALAGALSVGALLLSSCLPGDTRPTPASLLITAEPSPAVLSGVTTEDGWQISFEKLLVGIGWVTLNGAACNSYADAAYLRLLDLGVPGQQKVVQVFGLGTCNLMLNLSLWDAQRGAGVSEGDADFVVMFPNDAGTVLCNGQPGGEREDSSLQGASVYVRGQAARGDVVKRFEWAFPLQYVLGLCDPSGDSGGDHTLTLRRGEERHLALVVRAEELLRASPEDGAPLRFDALADADADGDQAISLQELSRVVVSLPGADAGVPPPCDLSQPTLRYLLEQLLVPRMIRVGTAGQCWGFSSATLLE
jgi:hypothetical protein